MSQLKFAQITQLMGDMSPKNLNLRVLLQSHCYKLLHMLPGSSLICCLETSSSFYPQKSTESPNIITNIFSAIFPWTPYNISYLSVLFFPFIIICCYGLSYLIILESRAILSLLLLIYYLIFLPFHCYCFVNYI